MTDLPPILRRDYRRNTALSIARTAALVSALALIVIAALGIAVRGESLTPDQPFLAKDAFGEIRTLGAVDMQLDMHRLTSLLAAGITGDNQIRTIQVDEQGFVICSRGNR
jgi:hypothetical protein